MNNKALLFALRDWATVMRSTAALLLIVFTWVMYSPAALAFCEKGIDEPLPEDNWTPKSQLLMQSLQALQQLINSELQKVGQGIKNERPTAFYETLHELQAQVLLQENDLKQNWPTLTDSYPHFETYTTILKQRLSTLDSDRKQLLNRQMMRVQYAFNLAQASKNKDVKTRSKQLEKSLATLSKLTPNKTKHSWDNEQLPFGTLPSAAREPSTSHKQLLENLGLSKDPLTANSQDMMMSSAMSTAGNAENLAQGIEIQFSDEIKAKVEELNYDPVQIYNWVYNNIRFIPSYGSLQGAAQAFDLSAGNATDTASILISMLRYAGVEARYKIGTVEIDADKARNWVGGVDYVDSVQVLLGQGGIPNALMIYQGQTEGVKLEHTWVEAYINDTWVSLDPSFKQYEFSKGIDLQNEVPFDATDLANQIEQSATQNEEEGWVQGIDQTAIETAMTSYQQSLESFLNEHHSDATVTDVLGGHTIVSTQALELSSALPYQQVIAEVSTASLPENMRHKFKYQLLNTNLKLEDYTANLAGKALAVSFKPATETDEQILLDYLPDNIESEDDIPTFLPYGLFNVVGEFTIDGQVVSTSNAMQLGTELKNQLGFYSPRFGWQTTSNPIVAADYQAVVMDLQGVTANQLNKIKTGLDSAKAVLENTQASPDTSDVSSLTRHSVTGNILQTGAMGYMAMTNVQAQLLALQSDIIYYREPSYGTFSTSASISYFFLQPQKVHFGAVVMDMDRMLNSAECQSNCWNNWSEFNQQSGAMMSAYEHVIPEQLFSTEENPAEAVSAVKALSIANAQGQKIYTLTSDNYSNVSSQIQFHSNDMRNEIASAVNQGKTVTVHEAPLTHFGWNGMGYIILDEETGAGAYKISSGANGGVLMILGLSLILTFGIFALVSGGVGALFALAFINAALAIFFQGLAMVLDSLGQERFARFACGFVWISLGGILGAVLTGFTALGSISSILIGEFFSGITTFLSCI